MYEIPKHTGVYTTNRKNLQRWLTVLFKLKKQEDMQSNLTVLSHQNDARRFQEHISAEPKEVLQFKESCFSCTERGLLNMVVSHIPHFKEVIVMAFNCDHCGYRTSEVKAGGAISKTGTRISLKVTGPHDMSRDLLKSETASVHIPEIELEITEGSLGGRFTTIEGLIHTLREQLGAMKGVGGEYAIEKGPFQLFLERLEVLESGEEPFTIIVDDPVSNSFIQNPYAPDMDPSMQIEEYIRSWEQDEDLGLHDIDVGEN